MRKQRKVTRKRKPGGKPAMSEYRLKRAGRQQPTAMGLAFKAARARAEAGSPGRESIHAARRGREQ